MSLGIYIHIPFCASKCNYCDFNSYVADGETYSVYADALCREIEGVDIPSGTKVDTVYFGGGTPTILEPSLLITVLDAVRGNFSLTDDCEITTECNPATIGSRGFFRLMDGGFNRLSIGMQSADDSQLKTLGRIHTFEDCKKCVSDARVAGFKNISVDLMFGLPEQDKESWIKSLECAVELCPEHISCYALKIEEGTPFAKMDLRIADDEESRNMYDACVEYLNRAGYSRYEISNFSKVRFESRHNSKYWLCDDFVGFGAGAYSCINGVRYSNVVKTNEYIKRLGNGQSVIEESVSLDDTDKMSEFVYLGLRMDKGIDITEFSRRFSVDIEQVFGDTIDKNIKRGTMLRLGNILKIAPDFVYVSNAILADFV